jgi:hypothetical protein
MVNTSHFDILFDKRYERDIVEWLEDIFRYAITINYIHKRVELPDARLIWGFRTHIMYDTMMDEHTDEFLNYLSSLERKRKIGEILQ